MKDKHRHNRRVNHICAYIVMFIAFIVFPLIAGGIDSGKIKHSAGYHVRNIKLCCYSVVSFDWQVGRIMKVNAMMICNDCGQVFDEPKRISERFGESDLDIASYAVCPYCGGDDYSSTTKCSECGGELYARR